MNTLQRITFAWCALLAGCGTLNNPAAPEKLSYAGGLKGSGVVILSTGALERCITMSTYLKVLPATSRYDEPPLRSVAVDGYVFPSDFTDQHGFIHAFALPPGDYYFAPFLIHPRAVMTKSHRGNFSVAEGEVVYLGEYFLRGCALSGRAEMRDRYERDMAVLRRKNGELAAALPSKRIPMLTSE